MTLQDLINEVERRKIGLIEQKMEALESLKTIKTQDNNLKFVLSEAILDCYAPLFKQCEIEICILSEAQRRLDQ